MSAELITLAGVAASSAISGTFSYLAGHRNGKAAFITAVQDAADQVITQLRTECDRMRGLNDDCEARHAACEDKVADLERLIADMMGGPVPPYTPGRKAA